MCALVCPDLLGSASGRRTPTPLRLPSLPAAVAAAALAFVSSQDAAFGVFFSQARVRFWSLAVGLMIDGFGGLPASRGAVFWPCPWSGAASAVAGPAARELLGFQEQTPAFGEPMGSLFRGGQQEEFLESPFDLQLGWVLGAWRGVRRHGISCNPRLGTRVVCQSSASLRTVAGSDGGGLLPRERSVPALRGGWLRAQGVSTALQRQDLAQELNPSLCSPLGWFFPRQKRGARPGPDLPAGPELSRPRSGPAVAAPPGPRRDGKRRPVPALTSGPRL